jgi:hypothetical protein
MQTLNVGAGQTETEYKEAAEKRRTDLLADSQSDANFFFWAAGAALLGTGLLSSTGLFPIRINFLVSVGAVDLLERYGSLPPLELHGVVAAWILLLSGLGFAARRGHRWAFLAGIVLYGADMIALILMFSIWAFGLHAFFLFRWVQGQRALGMLNEARASSA